MPKLLRRIPFMMVVLCSPLTAQAPGRWGCMADSLSGFNCAHYYNGTVSWSSDLRGPGVNQTMRVVATVTGGRVSCSVAGTDVGEFEGPGMMAVTHEATQTTGGGYSISVWCPEAAGQPPRRRSEPLIKLAQLRTADYTTLEGRDSHDNPDADSTNRITGTETYTWALRRP